MRRTFGLPTLLCLISTVFALAGCGGGGSTGGNGSSEGSGVPTWTVMVYIAADNDLEEYAIADMNEMETIGSTSQVTVAVQLDRAPGHDSTNGNWTTTRRYYITADSDTATINSQLIEDLGELDMAAPETLADFIQWGMDTYPADHYLLVLWNHGRGWLTPYRTAMALERPIKAIHIDDTSQSEMSLAELTEAFQQVSRVDVVAFDACLMGMIEVAYSIQDYADIMVASEENVPAYGLPYDQVLSRLISDPGTSPSTLSMSIVDEYIDHYAGSSTLTCSAIILASLNEVVSAADGLASAIEANMGLVRADVRAAQRQAQSYDFDMLCYVDYKDIYDFARQIRSLADVAAVRSAAQNVMTAVNSAVLYERNSGALVAASYGISVYLPDPREMLTLYSDLTFAQDTRWDEFLTSY